MTVRLLRLVLLGGIVSAVIVVTAAGGSRSGCAHGVSSVGPAVLIHRHLDKHQSKLKTHTEACLPN